MESLNIANSVSIVCHHINKIIDIKKIDCISFLV